MAFQDPFTGTPNDPLDVYSANWTIVGGTEGLYRIWLDAAGTAAAYNGAGSGSGGTAYFCPDQSSANKYAQAKLVTLQTRRLFIACNLVDRDTLVGCYAGGTGSAGYRLAKVVSGTITDLVAGTSPSMQGVNGDSYKVEETGDQYSLWYDSGSIGSWTQSGSDQTVVTGEVSTSNTRSGLVCLSGGSGTTVYDDFEAGALGVAGVTIPILMHHYMHNIGSSV